MSRSSRIGAVAAVIAAAGCQVDWGGGRIALENPAPPPDTTAAAAALEPTQLPLPSGPHLFAVTLRAGGEARLVPVAGIGDEDGELRLEPIRFPDDEDPTFRARYDSVFLASGRELHLLARGRRIGSLVTAGVSDPGSTGCPSLGTARALIVPGQDLPAIAFAVPDGVAGSDGPGRVPPVAETNSMNVAGPVLAERMIGEERGFLARRKSLTAVELPGDTLAAMAATWLVADTLAPLPPLGGDAVSLFFLARFEPVEGFIPIWEEIRRYDEPADKEAFEFVDWIRLGAYRLDFVKRYDASSVRLAASITLGDENREISWIEAPECRTLERLGAG